MYTQRRPAISPPLGSAPTRPSSSSRRGSCRARCRCNASVSTPRSRRRSSSCCRRRQASSPARSSASTAGFRTHVRPGPCRRTRGHGPSTARKGKSRASPKKSTLLASAPIWPIRWRATRPSLRICLASATCSTKTGAAIVAAPTPKRRPRGIVRAFSGADCKGLWIRSCRYSVFEGCGGADILAFVPPGPGLKTSG